MLKKMRIGLPLKFLSSISLVIILTSLSLTTLFIAKQNVQLKTALEERCRSLARNLANNSEYGVASMNREFLFRLTESVIQEEDVAYCIVYDRDGNVLAAAESAGASGIYRNVEPAFQKIRAALNTGERKEHDPETKGITYASSGGLRIHDVSSPIVFRQMAGGREEIGFLDDAALMTTREEVIGTARVGISMARMVQQQRDLARDVFFITIIVVICGILFSSLMVRRIVGPIKQLVLGTEKIAQGDLDYHVAIASNDEIGDLASSFNRMAEDIRTYVRELNKEKEDLLTLKITLEQRTDELEETLDKMKNIQQELLRSEKFATIGRLAASVAHELRNPLASLKNISFYLLKLGAFTDEKAKRMLDILSSDVRRANQIVTDLLDFSRTKKLNRVPVEMEEFIGRLTEQVSASENISLVCEVEPGEAVIDPDRIMQVLINLVTNARDAMPPEGGAIRVATKKADGFLEIRVTDNGAGMDRETVSRIFEPLFTTKVKGLGLGLAIVKEIIDLHFGQITVDSEKGKGTTFTILLPL